VAEDDDNGGMCGRFVQARDPSEYADAFAARLVAAPLPPSYNVAPTDPVYAVASHDGERLLGTFRWGLIPWWAKDRKIAARNINARVETVADKATFRESFATRRCLIPADGFYEWQVRPKGKLPFYIYAADGGPLALAGLWASWKDPASEERVRSCTILTGRPNDAVADIHDRMPVVLSPERWSDWLDPEIDDTEQLLGLLDVYPSDAMARHPVSTLVNTVANNLPECIAPLTTGAVDQDDDG
jgi:putative SOS response-associated peptidase YedK